MRPVLLFTAMLSASILFVSVLLPAAPPPNLKKASAGSSPYGEQKFKTTGSATAPITIEVYSDFQCPSCRSLFLETLPPLNAEYVATGKVRLIHRDFPLPMHQFSKLAAKYANCAGTIGRYDLVSTQLFKTQNEWDQNGNIDAALAKVLPPGEMQKLRAMVADPKLDEGTAQDVAMGMKDNVGQTPTMEIVSKGKRESVGGFTPFPILKQFIDGKLAH